VLGSWWFPRRLIISIWKWPSRSRSRSMAVYLVFFSPLLIWQQCSCYVMLCYTCHHRLLLVWTNCSSAECIRTVPLYQWTKKYVTSNDKGQLNWMRKLFCGRSSVGSYFLPRRNASGVTACCWLPSFAAHKCRIRENRKDNQVWLKNTVLAEMLWEKDNILAEKRSWISRI